MKVYNDIYKKDIKEVYELFDSSINGIDSSEINKRNSKYGKNIIVDSKKTSLLKVFISQYTNLLVIVLIIASILSLFTGGIENTIVIVLVITLNAVLGTFEYFKAEKSLNSLKKLTSLDAIVIRNGKKETINSNDLVCGDVVYLKRGDVVPADLRIIECNNLEIDESMLTGESENVFKSNSVIIENVSLGERKNCLFRGTKVINGKASGIVYSVGMNTEIGKIASMMQEVKKKKSPLEKNIDKFSRDLAILILGVCLIVFIMSIYKNVTLMDSLMFSISLAVAAIPEALQTIVTIVLAISTEKMAKENAIVKDIKAIETLGSVDVICTDKTGTITENKMVVSNVYKYNVIDNINNIKVDNLDIFDLSLILCNEAEYESSINNNRSINTDEALLIYYNNKTDISNVINKYNKIYEKPFSSKDKFSAVITKIKNKNYLFVKGASDVVLDMCSLSNSEKENILELINNKSKEGYRVLSVAYEETDKYKVKNLRFLGLVYLIDPIKENVELAIEEVKSYNVTPVMITGDHIYTAISIGEKVGIYSENDRYLTGEELEKLNDKELLDIIDDVKIYARVSPSDKIRIVSLLQEKGHIVGFLGDGVNDSPALKKADVGVAMGINGTDVSKEASDIILMDDNYETIVKAIIRGRKVFQNIQNSILFLIAGNIAGIFMVLLTSFLNIPIPFASVHLLFINLINDSLPAIAIGIDDKHNNKKDIIKPRKQNEEILSKRVIKRIIFEGLLIATCTMISYFIGLERDMYVARTMVFVTITVARLFYSFNCRGRFSFLSRKKKNYKLNKTLLASIVFGLVLINILLFVEPLNKPFDISKLKFNEVIISYLLSFIPFITIQILFIFRELKSLFKLRKLLRS